MNTTVNIQGLKGVEDALSQAGPKLAKRALSRALGAGAEVFVEEAKARAPILKTAEPNRRPGELRDSIVSVVKMKGKKGTGRARIGPRRPEGESNQTPGAWGLMVEFGTKDTHAQPYLRPGFDAGISRATDAFADVMKSEVESLDK